MSAIGFIGLGIMGDAMARQLIGTGKRKLVIWNRTPAKPEKLLMDAGADHITVAETPAEVIAACEITYVMLSTPEACKEVYEMEGGILDGVVAGKCVVDCATIAVEDMQRLSTQVIAKGGQFLEAPVSGSKGPAAQGQLIFLCGGDEALYVKCAKELDTMGKAKFFFGAVGAGTRMKLCVNMVRGGSLDWHGLPLMGTDRHGLNEALRKHGRGALATDKHGVARQISHDLPIDP